MNWKEQIVLHINMLLIMLGVTAVMYLFGLWTGAIG